MAKRRSYVQMKQALVASLRRMLQGVGNPFGMLAANYYSRMSQGVSNPFGMLAANYYSRGKGGKRAHTFTGVRKAQRAAAKRRNIAKRGKC